MRKARTWIQGHLTVLFSGWSSTPEILRNKICCLAGLTLVILVLAPMAASSIMQGIFCAVGLSVSGNAV